LPITYEVDNEAIAMLQGNSVTIIGSGDAKITATQKGNSNYESAAPLTQVLRSATVTSAEDKAVAVAVAPNPTGGKLKIFTTLSVKSVSITDLAGRSRLLPFQENELDIQSFEPGMYILTIELADRVKVVKIVKK
jgi:hypothetical protein